MEIIPLLSKTSLRLCLVLPLTTITVLSFEFADTSIDDVSHYGYMMVMRSVWKFWINARILQETTCSFTLSNRV